MGFTSSFCVVLLGLSLASVVMAVPVDLSQAIECHTADIIFGLDRSGSIGSSNFLVLKDFVKSVVQMLNIGPDHVQIGIVSYSSGVEVSFHLNTYGTEAELLSAIDNIYYTGGGTNTASALQVAREQMFVPSAGDREHAPNIFILLTDGYSNSYTSTVSNGNLLLNEGTVIIPVGITPHINTAELEALSQHDVIQVANFSELETIIDEVISDACGCNEDQKLVCWTCKNAADDDECRENPDNKKNWGWKVCSMSDPVCEYEVHRNDNGDVDPRVDQVTRGCKQRVACMVREAHEQLCGRPNSLCRTCGYSHFKCE